MDSAVSATVPAQARAGAGENAGPGGRARGSVDTAAVASSAERASAAARALLFKSPMSEINDSKTVAILAAALPWLVTDLYAAAYAASWCIARKIYCKKEL